MKFFCAHCQQELEADDAWAGHELSCPTCQQTFRVPVPEAAPPPPPQPAPRPTPAEPPKFSPFAQAKVALAYRESKPFRSRGTGCGAMLLYLLIAAVAAFGYATYRFQESPQRVWERFVDYLRAVSASRTGKTPTPEPGAIPSPVEAPPAPVTTPVPTPPPSAEAAPTDEPILDPVAWLIEHREAWPPEVALTAPTQLTRMVNGLRAGFVTLPRGAKVQVVEITPGFITVAQGVASQRLPLAATDLVQRAPEAVQIYREHLALQRQREVVRQRDAERPLVSPPSSVFGDLSPGPDGN